MRGDKILLVDLPMMFSKVHLCFHNKLQLIALTGEVKILVSVLEVLVVILSLTLVNFKIA